MNLLFVFLLQEVKNLSHLNENFSKLYVIYNIKCHFVRKFLNIKRVFMYKAIIIGVLFGGTMCSSVINCTKEENAKFFPPKKRYLAQMQQLAQMQKIEKKPAKVNGMAAKASKKSTIKSNQCILCSFTSHAKGDKEYNRQRHEARNHGLCPGYCKNGDTQQCKQFHNIITQYYPPKSKPN